MTTEAQSTPPASNAAENVAPDKQPKDTLVTTYHSITLNGERIDYTVT